MMWYVKCRNVVFFFFQAEDGIRDDLVTGVQTCALPISIDGVMNRGDGLLLVASAPHPAAHGPGAQTDAGGDDIRVAELNCFHDSCLMRCCWKSDGAAPLALSALHQRFRDSVATLRQHYACRGVG